MFLTSRRALVVPAILALLGGATTASADPGHVAVRTSETLSDLQTGVSGPFDGATAAFQLVTSAQGSHGLLRVEGVGASADGHTFGAHLHVGPCIAGDPDAARGHYNTDVVVKGILPPLNEISEETEMWLDITVDEGSATATASVPFVPIPATRSVVVHALETDHDTGGAGPRLACIPVVW